MSRIFVVIEETRVYEPGDEAQRIFYVQPEPERVYEVRAGT